MSQRLLVVVGSGPGIGSQTACQFASSGFDAVALLSRNAERLKTDAAKVSKASTNVRVETYPVDIGDHAALKKTLEKVESELGAPEVVLFNAARVVESKIGEEPPEAVIEDFKVMNIGLYVAATWALSILKGSHPSFLISGGLLWDTPVAGLFSLSMQKAAQVNFAGSYAQIAGAKGIHVATIDIGGTVADENPVINAKNIASKFWDLSQQDKSQWESMVKVGDDRHQFKQ